MNSSADRRVAIVTGGASGIGLATAHRLAAGGYALVLNYNGRPAPAEAAVKTITESGGLAIAAQADVANEHAVAAMFDLAEETFGGIDVVVNAAGVMRLAPLVEFDLETLDGMLRTNVRGTFVVSQQAARRLRGSGALINFSTSTIPRVLSGYTGYNASKGAVEAMTFGLANELRGRDVTVNAVAPGPTATPLFLEGKDQELLDRLAAQPPLERLGQPEDTAAVIAFLAGQEGHWVNGQVIRVNGGIA